MLIHFLNVTLDHKTIITVNVLILKCIHIVSLMLTYGLGHYLTGLSTLKCK